ncbi:heavy-metal-associated domain-containing protein [Butyrivibrio sp. MC2013]|uniref:heavy-metal-associated domain-containing protein n=1 Tax=Butyrivibrio sp. MC2013 TaxID=1280686 RepID=UPI0004020FCC|nr:heavy metal-associated domain-containing protein [Butyrivibrio sp. MC2013]
MNINVLVILILLLVFALAIRGSIKHLRGQGSCCGGGSSTVREADKKLNGPVIQKKVFGIDGMHCENCTERVKRALNRIDGISAKINLRKKEALVLYEKEVEDDILIAEIERLGYKVISVK